MKKRCKHQNGLLQEQMLAVHERDVFDGILDGIGYNNTGEITGYVYRCADCGKLFSFSWSGAIKQKWLKKIFDQLSK